MATLAPLVKVDVNNDLVNLVTQSRNIEVAVVAPSNHATATVGTVLTFTNLTDAITALTASTANGNFGIKIIEWLFNAQSALTVKYCFPGKNTASATTTTLNEAQGILAGETVFTVASGTSFTNGDLVMIGTGSTVEYRRITKSTNDFTVHPLDFAHSNGEAVVKITEVDMSTAAPTCRTALATESFRFYYEESQLLAGIKTFLETTRDTTNGLYTQAFVGHKFLETKATTKTNALSNNSKYICDLWGCFKEEKTGILYEGTHSAAWVMGQYLQKVSENSVNNTVLISLNSLELKGITDILDNEDGSTLTVSEADDLLNNSVGCSIVKRQFGSAKPRIYKVVTTWNKDALSQPTTTYSNIVDINAEIYMRVDLDNKIDDFLATEVAANRAITTRAVDLARLQAKVQSIVNSYDFLDRNTDTGGFEPIITLTSPSAGNVSIDIQYKAVESIDRVTLTLYKSIR